MASKAFFLFEDTEMFSPPFFTPLQAVHHNRLLRGTPKGASQGVLSEDLLP